MEKEILIQLVNKAKNGDQEAFEELLREAHTAVSYQCRKMLNNEQDAEDMTQEILMTVYTKLDSLEEPAAFYGWLGRITANQCKNAMRKHKDLQFAEDEDGNSVLDEIEDLDERQIPDKALDNAETVRMIDEIVSQLPEAQRITTLLYYYNEMSIKEIAKATGVSENAVKGRLNLARKAIKSKVEGYEKQGIKLYSVSILPLLWYFLHKAAQTKANSAAAEACVAGVMASSTAAAVGGATTTVTVGTATATTAVTAAGSALAAKITAGILAGVVALGGIGFAISKVVEPEPTVAQTNPTVAPVSEALLSEAYTAYENILQTASSPESDLEVRYYAYLDLDGNGLPELIVADNAGTPDTWTIFEVYSYDESGLKFCGASNSRYTYLTYVNNKYVLGTHRMGAEYIGVNECITTTVYCWNEDMTCNDPAISINGGDWEYITDGEFDYYNAFDAEAVAPGGFVETIEVISLQYNTHYSYAGDETGIEHVDIFKNVEIHFSGISGDAMAKLSITESSDLLNACIFSITPNYDLKNGDVVTVAITNTDIILSNFSVLPEMESMTFTVSGLEYYATAEDLPMDVVQQIGEQLVTEQQNENDEDPNFTYSDVELYGIFFLEGKDDTWADENQLHFVIHYDRLDDNGNVECSYFIPLYIKEVVVSVDGSVSLHRDDCVSLFFYDSAEEYTNKYKDDYDITRIG